MSIIDPTKNTSLIIDDFISYATEHLKTISGVANTISLYPAIPTPVPGPGVVNWTGYTIPPAAPSAQLGGISEAQINEIKLSEEQLAVANLASLEGLPISEATARAFEYQSRNAPPISFEESERLFEQSLPQGSIKEPTKEELENEIQTSNDIPQNTITDYKTKVKVPDDVVLAMRRWGVGKNNPLERAHFLSQCAHESGGFRAKVENLNYSAAGLLGVFPKYFKTPTDADLYARKPELIASKVYGNRMGNGTEDSKDGWKYRGRGYIQLTGKSNYINAEKVIRGGIINTPDLVERVYPGDSACFFWTANNLKRHISTDNDLSIKKLTKSINGGDKGLDDRKKKFILYWNELQKDPTLWA